MVPQAFAGFFVGSMGASATLVGLLFVAMSIRPERITARGAPPEPQAVAASAFTALANTFFISLGGAAGGPVGGGRQADGGELETCYGATMPGCG